MHICVCIPWLASAQQQAFSTSYVHGVSSGQHTQASEQAVFTGFHFRVTHGRPCEAFALCRDRAHALSRSVRRGTLGRTSSKRGLGVHVRWGGKEARRFEKFVFFFPQALGFVCFSKSESRGLLTCLFIFRCELSYGLLGLREDGFEIPLGRRCNTH